MLEVRGKGLATILAPYAPPLSPCTIAPNLALITYHLEPIR